MSAAPPAASPFELLAARYDQTFTASEIGSRLRRAVWRHLDRAFGPGDRVLDLGCGTGEDAAHLATRGVRVVAIDGAEAMVEAARRKVDGAGVADLVEVRSLPIEELGRSSLELRDGGLFTGAYSNFGALNCVQDLSQVAAALARLLRSGAPLLVCAMGRLAPWEWAHFLVRRNPGKAFRRLHRGGTEWRGLRVFYPSIAEARAAFAELFVAERAVAIGALLPPTYLEAWASAHPRLLDTLDRWERRLESVPPLPHLSDHYLLKLVRR